MSKSKSAFNLSEVIKSLDGVAVANIAEPSPGDLERVLKANSQSRSKERRIRDAMAAEIGRLKEEVEVLRHYGNKDCTAMADEELERRKKAAT